MTNDNIFAFTETNMIGDYPAYVSLNLVAPLDPKPFSLTVREQGQYIGQTIRLSRASVEMLMQSIQSGVVAPQAG